MSPKGVLWTVVTMRLRLADGLAADGARVLERHRVALLRHDAAALHEAVAEAQVAELHRAPQQQVLDDPAEADDQRAGRRHALEQVVDGRDAAVGVAGRAAEAEQLAGAVAIDREAGAGDGAGAERVAVGRLERRRQPRGVALELLDHGEQVVRDRRRLRRLGVGVRAVDGVLVAVGQHQQRLAQVERRRRHRRDELALPHPVHRHVDVVAAARGVQAAGDVFVARLLDQALDVEEQVFVGAVVQHLRARCRSRCRRGPRAARGRRRAETMPCSVSITRCA